ncbi:MAG: hypothetical protein AAF740_12240, partial [Bacteroidota bacterium]
MIWIKDFEPTAEQMKNKQVIVGHVTHTLTEIQDRIYRKSPLIRLDNGVYKKSYEGKGGLCALETRTSQLFWQKAI